MVCLTAVLCPGLSQATPLAGSELVVQRSETTESCPTEEQVAQAVRAELGPEVVEGLRVEVSFEHRDGAHEAQVRVSGARSGLRRLRAEGADCAALGEVLTVTLALILDPHAEFVADEEPSVPPPPLRGVPPAESQPAPLPPLPAAPPQPAPAPGERELRLRVLAGFAAAAGIAPGMSPGAGLALRLEGAQASLELGGAWFRTEELAHGPGEVEVGLVAGQLLACVDPELWDRVRAGGCLAFVAGALSAAGRGYAVEHERTRPLTAAGIGGRLTLPVFREARAALRVEWLAPLHRESFSVAGVEGHAFRTSPTGVWLGGELDVPIL
jgi:hypothetical protein